MLVHVEMDKKSGEDGATRTRKKFHSCSVCNKKFRRPCEVKEHMLSHKSTTPFICKYCGKNLKSKTGAVYHTLKTHKIDVGNNKNLGEHFYLDVIKEKGIEFTTKFLTFKYYIMNPRTKLISDEQKDESDNDEDFKEENENDSGESKGEKAGGDSSSSEDELPLARRRKEFIYEKFKQVRFLPCLGLVSDLAKI